jgi:hypothetical protein
MLRRFVRVPEGNELDVIPVKIAARREGSGAGRGSRSGYRKPASALNSDPWTALAAREHVERLTAEHGPKNAMTPGATE